MLLRLRASNFLSISEPQELSLVASKLKGPEGGLIVIPGTDMAALPAAVIYGANASGKTNFVKAFSFMRSAIINSHAKGNPEGGVPRLPFQLSEESVDLPTFVEADFLVDGVRYQYGFECDDQKFLAEWLYTFPEGKRRKMFERNGSQVDFGSQFRGPKKVLVDLMRSNSLFISTATQNDHEELGKLVSFFRRARFSSTVSVAKDLINTTFKKNQIDARTIAFLNAIGTGIVGHRQKDVETPENVKRMIQDFTDVLKKHGGELDDTVEGPSEVVIELAHLGADGNERYFGLERESSGTRRLILLMNIIFKALDQGSLVIIDELDASLHTHAAEQVLNLFSHPDINKNGAQVVATTHDTNLLNSKCLRRDQIWFCEKDRFGSTSLFPLSDIQSRQTDNFEQGYLEGRYGGIPFSGDPIALFRGL